MTPEREGVPVSDQARIAEIEERATRTQALAPLDRAPVGEWPQMVLDVLAALRESERQRDEQADALIRCAELAGTDGESVEAARSGALKHPPLTDFAIDAVSELRPPPPELRQRVTDAWSSSPNFVWALSLCLHARRARMLDGPGSHLYAIAEPDGNAWKIGLARDPAERLLTLQQANPRRLVLYAWVAAPCRLEPYLHHVLRRERLLGEWFYGRRTLAVVALLESAQEIGWDVDRYWGGVGAVDTMMVLTDQVDDALAAA